MKWRNKQRGIFGIDDIISGMFSLGTAKISADAARHDTDATNATNVRLAQENRDFLAKMDNTSMQRRMQDLKDANLNPMLAISQGGADTPSTSAATVQSNADTDLQEGKNINSAMQSMLERVALKKQIETADANINKINSEAELNRESAFNVHSQGIVNANMATPQNLEAASREQWFKAERIRKEIENVIADTNLKELDKEQLNRLNPLLIEAQKLQNQSFSLGIPEQKASAEWWSGIGAAGKGIEPLMDVVRTILPFVKKAPQTTINRTYHNHNWRVK